MTHHSKFPAIGRLPQPWQIGLGLGIAVLVSGSILGCGRIISQKATDQLIAGDAVDRTVSQTDFRILTGKKIFLDTQFINKTVPGIGFVTSEYMVSSVRQKMMCDGCLLQEKIEDSDFVVEMRIGALGADGHEVIYGVPANNFVSIAASVVPTSPQAATALPSMPELSFGKKDDQMAAAKIALFAYNRKTREPIWQSGISESRSVVADRWFFGAGPFHKGNIYGSKKQQQVDAPLFGSMDDEEPAKQEYFTEHRFADPTKSLAETPATPKPVAVAAAPAAAAPATAAAPAATPVAAPAATAATTAAGPPAGNNVAKTSTPPADASKAPAPAAAAPQATPVSTTPAASKTDHSISATPNAASPASGPAIPPVGPASPAPQAVSSATP